MLVQCIAACVVVFVAMMITLGLVRLAAKLVFGLLIMVACAFTVYSIRAGFWIGWFEVLWGGLASGVLAALLSLPIMPFTGFLKKSG